jgi:OOP family OmpA-OmpF porin
MRAVVSALALVLLFQFPAQAAPKAQYSPQQLEQDFSNSASSAPAAPGSDDCASQGMATAPDGSCQPAIGHKRGFSLAGPTVSAPASHPRPSNPSHGAAYRPPAAPVAQPGQGRNLLITFGNSSAVLTEQAKANARAFAQALTSPVLRSARFAIDGHTNAVGNRDYNLKLSRARAQALVDFLASLGVDRSRLDPNGYGFDRPSDASHPTAAINRRVEARRLS